MEKYAVFIDGQGKTDMLAESVVFERNPHSFSVKALVYLQKDVDAELSAKDAEIARMSTREDELNALCLDYQIDLDAARQENTVLFEQASEDSDVICRLKRIIAQQRAALNEWIDIAESQSIYDEFNKRHTHSFMSAGEHMWKLLGLSDPYVPQEEFYAAVKRYKDSVNVFSEVHNE